MKIELSDEDMTKLAEIVTNNLSEKIMASAVRSAHYEAMVEKGKNMALRLYGDMSTNDGVWQVVTKQVSTICREDLRYVIREELNKLIGDNEGLQKQLFAQLLEGVVDKAKALAYKVNYGLEEG